MKYSYDEKEQVMLSKDDERWLACLDRAIALHRGDAGHETIVRARVMRSAREFYDALPNVEQRGCGPLVTQMARDGGPAAR